VEQAEMGWPRGGAALRSRLPTMRHRRRYLAFEVNSEDEVSKKDLFSEIYAAQSSLLGDLGGSTTLLKLIKFDGRYGILRCSHLRTRESRAVLSCVSSINSIRVAFRVLGISGTIRRATEKYIPQLRDVGAEEDRERIELGAVSGTIARKKGLEIDLYPDEKNSTRGFDTRYLGLTSFDLNGGCDDADGTSDGL
jgi:ribonuclease P/MRP protein subunit POP5